MIGCSFSSEIQFRSWFLLFVNPKYKGTITRDDGILRESGISLKDFQSLLGM